jgi:hypothetical protein
MRVLDMVIAVGISEISVPTIHSRDGAAISLRFVVHVAVAKGGHAVID